MKFTAIVPILSNKGTIRENFILLKSKPLFLYIFETLLENVFIDKIICYSSNADIKSFLPLGVKFIKRDKRLDKSDIRQQDILTSIASEIKSDYYILCSVTSPFISNASITKGIESVLNHQYNSSLSVRKVNAFTWFLDKPLNFSLDKPLNTDEIESLYIETKGFYIFSRQHLLQGTCYGDKISYIEVNPYESLNIKTQEDIEFANNIHIDKPKIHSKYFFLSKICKHIIFDMDGVLIDSIELMKKAWKYSGGEKYAPFSEYEKYIGIPFVKICEKLNIKSTQIPTIKQKYFDFSKRNVQEIKLYNGVQETLRRLKNKNIQLSVVTSKDYQAALGILEYFNLRVNHLIAPSASYKGRNKPFGDPLLHSCILAHSLPNESIFIGDMLSDYQSAKHANIDFIFADYGYGKIHFPTISIQNIEEILLLIL